MKKAVFMVVTVLLLGSCAGTGDGLRQSDFIRNAEMWESPGLREEGGFQLDLEYWRYASLDDEAGTMRASILHHGVGELVKLTPDVRADEWGYSVTHLDGMTDGASRQIVTNYAGDNAPKTRAEAVKKLEEFLHAQYIRGADHPWFSMNGHYPWHHYAGEFGFDVLASEIGESINSYQWHIALNRGAARQYRTPWSIDFSAWHAGGITDYTKKRIWGEASGPDNGHSMSLFRRSMFMTYMAGADSFVAEAGCLISFFDDIENGVFKLSPYGEVCKEFYSYINKNPDRGIAYTPFAIVLDFYHGAYPGFEGWYVFGSDKFDFENYRYVFGYTEGDFMTWRLVDSVWPGGWEVMGRNEEGTMVNGPYGDVFDVLLQNAPQAVLNSYPALILSGQVELSGEEAARYRAYAEQGGTLILNTAYLRFFPEYAGGADRGGVYEHTRGSGRVIVYGPDYEITALDDIIRNLLAETVPFSLSEDVQYLINVKDGSLILTLINNEGVTKEPHIPPEVDDSAAKTISAAYTGELKVRSVKELRSGKRLRVKKNAVTVEIGPGDVAVLEFYFR